MTNIEILNKSVIKRTEQAEAVCKYFKVGSLVVARKRIIVNHSVKFVPANEKSKEKININDVFLLTGFHRHDHSFPPGSAMHEKIGFWSGDFLMHVLASNGHYYCNFGNLNPTKFVKKID